MLYFLTVNPSRCFSLRLYTIFFHLIDVPLFLHLRFLLLCVVFVVLALVSLSGLYSAAYMAAVLA